MITGTIPYSMLIVAGAIIAVLVVAVVLLILRFWPQAIREDVRAQTVRTAQLQAEVTKLSGLQDVLLKMLETAEAKRQEEAAKRAEAERKIAVLEEQVRTLRRQLEEKKVIEPQTNDDLIVLGIWPDTPGQPMIDQLGEADSLYNAGYQYTALRGARANRGGIILEIDRVRPNVIQVGSHGSAAGILLSDGVAEPGWWGRVLSGKGVNLMVLLACDSSQQDEINVSDALIAAGVKAVVSCDSAIGDKDAVRFSQLLYANLSAHMPLDKAVDRAKLAVSRKAGEMIRLREAN